MTLPFLDISELNVGSFDAVNYSGRQEKGFLTKVFLRDSVLDRVLERKRYFVVGEKGTGKTAYATLLSNSEYKNTSSSVKTLAATDYAKFIKLKEGGHLPISSYEDIWRSILLLLSSAHIRATEKESLLDSKKFKAVNEAINQYYDDAFSPEIVNAIEFVEKAENNAELILEKFAKLGDKYSRSKDIKGAGFQNSLMHLEKKFKEAITSLKLKKDHIIFIDGIDIRPSDIEYKTYIKCLQGLANAIWQLNLDFFGNINDSKGRIKIVALIRPDIFSAINFHNSNAKMRDNAVNLEWDTTYKDYRGSRIFKLIDGILGKQQNFEYEIGKAWDHYFPYNVLNRRIAEKEDNPFIAFLRNSFYRPRDVISYIKILQDYVTQHKPKAKHFTDEDFIACQSTYSEYLLGEVRDYLAFYHADADFDELTGFFNFLNGRSNFDWTMFKDAFDHFNHSNFNRNLTIKELTSSPEELLQFLYSMNVIGYDERTDDKLANFMHWSFRDRSPVKLNPKIPPGLLNKGFMPYSVHPGLVRALKVGGAN